jgi:hypothetical protein
MDGAVLIHSGLGNQCSHNMPCNTLHTSLLPPPFNMPKTSGEFGPFFSWKILCIGRNHIFQLKIRRDFAQRNTLLGSFYNNYIINSVKVKIFKNCFFFFFQISNFCQGK